MLHLILNIHLFLIQKPVFLLSNNPFVTGSSSEQGKEMLGPESQLRKETQRASFWIAHECERKRAFAGEMESFVLREGKEKKKLFKRRSVTEALQNCLTCWGYLADEFWPTFSTLLYPATERRGICRLCSSPDTLTMPEETGEKIMQIALSRLLWPAALLPPQSKVCLGKPI